MSRNVEENEKRRMKRLERQSQCLNGKGLTGKERERVRKREIVTGDRRKKEKC